MTLTADFRTAHGAVLRNARSVDAGAAQQEEYANTQGQRDVLPCIESRIFTIFPERAASVKAQLRDTFRRKLCLIGMCAPTSVFLTLAAWYVWL